MAEQVPINTPNYSRIYTDLVIQKFPALFDELKTILTKKKLSNMDIITLNKKLFGKNELENNNRLRSYSKKDILQILDYQKKKNLNNSQLAEHYQMSRNTITKWRKIFQL